jgi:Zn-dependent protease with chaperone function
MVTVPRRPATLELRAAGAWSEDMEDTKNFHSSSFAELPPPIEVRKLPPPSAAWLLIPWIAILAIPAATAVVFRRTAGWSQYRVVAMSWLNAGIWLLCLTALPPGRMIGLLAWFDAPSLALQLAVVLLMFCLPPLTAITLCLLILTSDAAPAEERIARRFLARSLLPEAAFALFCGGPLVGFALSMQNVMAVLGGFALGFPSGFAAVWLAKYLRAGSVKPVESGRLRDRVTEFAARAGTSVRSVSVLWNWSRDEANAAAWLPGRGIFITDSLLRAVTKREADAILAHEVGHLRDRPWVVPPRLCCTFTIVYVVVYVFFLMAGPWVEHLAAPVAFGVLLFSLKRLRGREYRADQWSGYVTQDPMALMAGLGKVAKLHGVAFDWGTLAGSIMTHPPLRKRVCVLARHCQIPESRAVAIMEDPESALAPGIPAGEPYDPAVECASAGGAFSRTKKLRQVGRMFLAYPALLVILVFALAAAASSFPIFALGLPLVSWLATLLVASSHRRFLRIAADGVSRSLPPQFEGRMIGLVPCADLIPNDGFYAWDLGKLGEVGGDLAYLGERASFSVARKRVLSMEPVHRRIGIRSVHALRIQTETGAFLVLDPISVVSRRGAKSLEQLCTSWWAKDAASETTAPAFELPTQSLPVMTQQQPGSVSLPAALLRILFLQFAVGAMLWQFLPGNPLNAIAMVAAPVLYCLGIFPRLISQRKAATSSPASPGESPLTARMQAEEAIAVASSRLLHQAERSAGDEAERLLAQALQECDRLLEQNPRHVLGLRLRSRVLSEQAIRRPRAAADRLYAQAEGACSTAIGIAPHDVDLLDIHAHLLLHRALLNPGEDGVALLAKARRLLEDALTARPGFDHARILWAHVLAEQPRRCPDADTDQALEAALAAFDSAANTTHRLPSVLRGSAMILVAQAMRARGENHTRLLLIAKEKFLESETHEPGTGAYRAACVSAHLGQEDECRRWLEASREPGILVTRDEMADEPHFAPPAVVSRPRSLARRIYSRPLLKHITAGNFRLHSQYC